MTFYSSKSFKKLQKQWYNKLKKEGFDDIECTKPGFVDSPYLKRHTLSFQAVYNSEKEEHYARCRAHLIRHSFKNKIDKFLFTLYTNGMSYRDIIIELKRKHRQKRSVFYVHARIKRLKMEMEQLKLWEAE